jgi:PKD repeat protein
VDPGVADTHTVTVDWGDGTTGDSLTASHRFDDDGTYTLVVTARDDDGGAGGDTLTVTVHNVAPTVDAGPDRAAAWGVPVPFVGVAFDPSAADTAAGLTGGWRFGDGTETGDLAALHAYDAPGDYAAVFTVADKDGGAASDTVAVAISRRATRLVYAGPAASPFGATILAARLEDAVDAPTARLAGRTVRFTLNGATYTALTDATGFASVAPRVTGGTVTVEFAGDALYLPASAQTRLVVTYDFGGAGFFAIGDGNTAPGAEVTFWSSQWWLENDQDIASFKGWVPGGPPACGQAWSSGGGNSPSPPATVPRYLAVAVTADVAKAGWLVTGDSVAVVVLETHGGYAAAPGHAGTGTVVARVCAS